MGEEEIKKKRRGQKLGFEWEKDSTGPGNRAVTAVTRAIQYAGIGLRLPHATARRAEQFYRAVSRRESSKFIVRHVSFVGIIYTGINFLFDSPFPSMWTLIFTF